MHTLVYNARPYDRDFLSRGNTQGHRLEFLEARLTPQTAPLAAGYLAVSAFVNDDLSASTLEVLANHAVRYIALRCAGFNQVDLEAAARLGIKVARVPAYSPYAVAEHTVALILALNRRIHRAYHRVREQNFSLDGLLGFDLHGKTAGIVGTGKIGAVLARILNGFGCRLLAHDVAPNPECLALGVSYVPLAELCAEAEIISLHCPLTPGTHHLIDAARLAGMQDGVMLINTSRGGLIDTAAVIEALKAGKIGYLGLDVYEEESDLFFRDLSSRVLQDDLFARLQTFPNVLITGHQAYFTAEALANIAATTLKNLADFESKGGSDNEVSSEKVV